MIKKIKTIMIALVLSLGISAPLALAGTASAQIQESLCSGINLGDAGSTQNCTEDTGGSTINSIVEDVVNFLSWIVGVISVIMIIVGGFRYITSGGDSTKVTSAKNTIIYALIGLILVALAQFIVNFVIARVTS